MRVFVAILCALAICLGQYFAGSGLRPALALPSYGLLGLAGLLSIPLAWNRAFALPRWDCLLWAAAFVAWALFRQVYSIEPWMAGAFLRLTLACAVMYLILASALATPASRIWFLGILMVDGIIQGGIAAAQLGGFLERCPQGWFSEFHRLFLDIPIVQSDATVMRRALGLYVNPNHLAWFLNTVGLFGIALACLGRGRAWQKVIYAYVGIACLGAGLLTLSRGGVLGLVAGILAMVILAITAIFVSGTGRRWALASMLVAAVVLPTVIVVTYASQSLDVQTRLNTLFLDKYRPEIWKTSLRHLQTSPFVGTGGGTYVVYSRLYRTGASDTDDYQAHNDWVQVASEYGIIGFTLFLLAVIVHFHAGWQGYLAALRYRLAIGSLPQSNSSALLMGALAVFAMFAVHSLTDFNLQVAANALLAAAVAGILAGSRPESVSGEGRSAPRNMRILYACLAGSISLALLLNVWNSRGEAWALGAENDLLTNRLESAGRKAFYAVTAQPGNPWPHYISGRVALAAAATLEGKYRTEEKQAARESFEKALALSPDESVFRSGLAGALLAEGQLDAARSQALWNIERNPSRAISWVQLGMVAQQQGDLSLALQYYQLASGLWGSGIDRQKLKILQERERASQGSAR